MSLPPPDQKDSGRPGTPTSGVPGGQYDVGVVIFIAASGRSVVRNLHALGNIPEAVVCSLCLSTDNIGDHVLPATV
ncbi:hypothetical protein [Streptomyces sp. NPDC101234]|uniref:hypothetical protein n=1 Tax=Streptomyces sp. NPDC101234 TaxID=3366138 RepID=UPI0038180B0E